MNLFKFLKSTKGAIKPLNALLISGAAGAMFAYAVNSVADRQIEAERAVRTLSGISATNPQAGMQRQGGMLTSINVRDGRNQLATAEERAAMQGNSELDRYVANQRALENMDSFVGRAAQFSESDGLNTGNRDVVQEGAAYRVGNPRANADYTDPVAASAAARPSAAPAEGTRLQSASVARASGNSFNSTSGPVSSSAAGGTRSGANRAPAQRLSGSMPGGSNIISQRGLDGATARANNTMGFGREKDGRLGRTRNAGAERDELKDVVKKSAAAASNPNASANEGARAFLANSQSSGGIAVDGAGDPTTSATSEDLTAPTAQKLKAVGNKLDEVENKQEERNRKHRQLILQMIATFVGSIGMIVTGALVLRKFEAQPHTKWLIGGAMIAAVGAANAALFIAAKKFLSEYGAYGGTWIAYLGLAVSPLLVAAMVQTVINPNCWKNFTSGIWAKFKSQFSASGLLASNAVGNLGGIIDKK